MAKAKLKKIQNKPEVESVPRKLLLAVLDKVRPAVDTTGATGILQARHFIIQGGRVAAYNDMISVSAPLGFDTGLEVTVQADDLYKVLTQMGEDEIWLEFEGETELVVSSATVRSGMAAMPLEQEIGDLLANVKGLKKNAWEDIPEGFFAGLEMCLVSVSTKREDVAFSAVRVYNDRLLSTDNLRLSRYILPKKINVDMLLSYGAIKELVKHKMIKVQQHQAWAHFKDADGIVFSTRLVDVDFPDGLDKYIDEMEGVEVTLPPGVAEALQAVMVFSPGEEVYEREAEIRFKKGKIVCRSQNDRGWIERTVATKGVTTGIPTLWVNPLFFIDILQRLSSCVVGDGKAMFTAENFQHVIILPEEEEE